MGSFCHGHAKKASKNVALVFQVGRSASQRQKIQHTAVQSQYSWCGPVAALLVYRRHGVYVLGWCEARDWTNATTNGHHLTSHQLHKAYSERKSSGSYQVNLVTRFFDKGATPVNQVPVEGNIRQEFLVHVVGRVHSTGSSTTKAVGKAY